MSLLEVNTKPAIASCPARGLGGVGTEVVVLGQWRGEPAQGAHESRHAQPPSARMKMQMDCEHSDGCIHTSV